MKELLIVEDDSEMQEFYKDMLQGEQFTVTLASNADDGLKKIKETQKGQPIQKCTGYYGFCIRGKGLPVFPGIRKYFIFRKTF